MKNLKFLCSLVLILFSTSTSINAQVNLTAQVDTSMFKTRLWCGYNASAFKNSNLRIAQNSKMNTASMPKLSYPANSIFDCGKFRLYYEDIALSTGDGFDDPADGLDRRNTLCAVYQYIQNTFEICGLGL